MIRRPIERLSWYSYRLWQWILKLVLGPSPAENRRRAFVQTGEAMAEGLRRGIEQGMADPPVTSLEEFLDRVKDYGIFGPNRPPTIVELLDPTYDEARITMINHLIERARYYALRYVAIPLVKGLTRVVRMFPQKD